MGSKLLAHLRRQWMGALALFLVLTSGTAYAANTVFSTDIVDGEVKTPDIASNAVGTGKIGNNQVFSDDVRDDTLAGGGLAAADLRSGSVGSAEVANNSLGGADIKNGEVSVLDTNKTIPAGATITGAFNEFEDDSGGAGGLAELKFGVDFNGLRPPAPLTDADVNFDDVGISAAAAANAEESSGCTGGLAIPTAPPGKVCIYLFDEGVADNSGFATRLGGGTGFSQADDKGFRIAAVSDNQAFLAGTWAYTAP